MPALEDRKVKNGPENQPFMQKTKPFRFPGTVSFERSEADRFYGRRDDGERLLRFVSINKLSVLHGRSGMGKTSLLNAGLLPCMEADGFFTLKIRFNAFQKSDERTTPRLLVRQILREAAGGGLFLDEVENDGPSVSLWQDLKALEWKMREKKGVLLVFDQFEELFSYPKNAVDEFVAQFVEALENRMPEFFQRRLYEKINADPAFIARAADQIEFIEKSTPLRALFSVRSDRLALLGRMSSRLPSVLKNCFELKALSPDGVREAIVEPARQAGDFGSPAFEFEPAAVAKMLERLSDGGEQEIQPFQIQLVCRELEMRAKNEGLRIVQPSDLDEIEDILQNFYARTLDEFPEPRRPALQKMIEEGFIFEEKTGGVRVPIYGGSARNQFGVDETELALLVEKRLLRSEASSSGSALFELCHDTMIEPILRVKRRRVELETRRAVAEKQRAEAEKQALEAETRRAELEAERRKKRRANAVAAAFAVLALAAFGAAFFAFEQRKAANFQKTQADESRLLAEKNALEAARQRDSAFFQKAKAETATRQAEQNARLASEQKTVAQKNALEARRNAAAARAKEAEAKQARDLLAVEKNVSDEARKKAEANFDLAQKLRLRAEENEKLATDRLAEIARKSDQIRASLLAESAVLIRKARLDLAFEKQEAALLLAATDTVLADQLLETAFFALETGDGARADSILKKAWRCSGRAGPPPDLPDFAEKAAFRAAAQASMRALDAGHFAFLEKRYLPEMVAVAGGVFRMGCQTGADCPPDELPAAERTVGDFSMARTEATVWQWALFCAATGADLAGFAAENDRDGERSITNVSWTDAARYANWLSARAGLEAVYGFKKDGFLEQILPDRGGFRLPTEAEWEFAARAGGRQPAAWEFAGGADLGAVGWFAGNSAGSMRTGQKKGNALGFYDLSGNAQEWCGDLFRGSAAGERAIRGGTFKDLRNMCAISARRSGHFETYKNEATGLRVCAKRGD